MVSVDDLDRFLIRCLQDSPRATYATIARQTNVSETTVKRRIESLMEGGVISTNVFPNPRLLGYQVQASIGITADLALAEEIAVTVRDFPEVAYVASALGRYDLLIYVVVPTVNDLTRFMMERLAPIEGIRHTETVLTPRVYKAFANWKVPINGFEPALPPDDDVY